MKTSVLVAFNVRADCPKTLSHDCFLHLRNCLQEERQLREALEASRRTAELEQQRQAAMSQQAAALSVGATGADDRQQQQAEDAMDEDTDPLGHNAAAAGGGVPRPSFAPGAGGRGRGMGRAGRGGRAGRAGRRGGAAAGSSGPQWQQFSEGFEGVGESADPTEGPPAAKQRQAQRVADLPPETDTARPHAHRVTSEGAQRGPVAAHMAAATAAGARAQQQQQPRQQTQQRQRQQQQQSYQWQPRKPAVSAGSSTTCNIVDDAGSDTDSDSVTGPFAGGQILLACVLITTKA